MRAWLWNVLFMVANSVRVRTWPEGCEVHHQNAAMLHERNAGEMSKRGSRKPLTKVENDASIDIDISNNPGEKGHYKDRFLYRLEKLISIEHELTQDALFWVLKTHGWAEGKPYFNFQVKESVKLELNHVEKYKRRRKNKEPYR